MKYRITVGRTSYGEKTFDIESDNESSAATEAMDLAANSEYSSSDVEYKIEYLKQLKEKT